MGEDSQNLIDHNYSPVVGDNAVDYILEISGIEHSELVATTTPKEVAKEAAGRQLPVYWGHILTVLFRELMQP